MSDSSAAASRFFVDELKARFGLDFAFANELEVADGKLTGKVLGTIVDGERKAQILKDMAQVYTCRLEQTVAIGDGANDIFMLQTAGLGHRLPRQAEAARGRRHELESQRAARHAALPDGLQFAGFANRVAAG